jgi:hypothetical protein
MRTYDNLQNLKLCFGFSDSLSIQWINHVDLQLGRCYYN